MSSKTLKQEVAPKGLAFKMNQFMIGDKYASILTVIQYPNMIGPGYLSNVTSIPGVKVVVTHIPIDFSTMSTTINKEIVELKEEYEFKDLDEYLKRIGINSKPEKLYGDIFKEKAKDPKFNEILNNTINNFLDVK